MPIPLIFLASFDIFFSRRSVPKESLRESALLEDRLAKGRKVRVKTLDVIRLHNAVFYAYHGVMSDEQNLGGKFEVDVDLHCDLSEAKKSDSLHQTVNYEKVYGVMKQAVVGKKYLLIEALAQAIASGILDCFPSVRRVTVRVRKPGAAVHGVIDHVEVEIESVRNGRE